MPRIDVSGLPDESRIWIFGVSPPLDETKGAVMLQGIDRFLDSWSAHGEPITSARDLRNGSFLIICVDQRSETSGCSIDRMFDLLQQLERDLSVKILDADRLFYLGDDGLVATADRKQFRENCTPTTVVFDVLAERLGDVRSGRWQRPAKNSWHRTLLRKERNPSPDAS